LRQFPWFADDRPASGRTSDGASTDLRSATRTQRLLILGQLKAENAKLKPMYAELALENAAIRDCSPEGERVSVRAGRSRFTLSSLPAAE